MGRPAQLVQSIGQCIREAHRTPARSIWLIYHCSCVVKITFASKAFTTGIHAKYGPWFVVIGHAAHVYYYELMFVVFGEAAHCPVNLYIVL